MDFLVTLLATKFTTYNFVFLVIQQYLLIHFRDTSTISKLYKNKIASLEWQITWVICV